MKTYTLTDETWYRGRGTDASYLNAGPGKPVCCIGNLLAQEGVEVPEGAQELGHIDRWDEIVPAPLVKLKQEKSKIIFSVYLANDTLTDLTSHERVARINKLTEPFGFRFEFVD